MGKPKSMRVSALLGMLILGSVCALYALPREQETVPPRREVSLVDVAPVEAATIRRTVRFSGVTRSSRQAALSFSIPARLQTRSVDVGDRVTKGQVLAALDQREFRHAVSSAEAMVAELKVRLAQAERDRKRIERLTAARATSSKELEHTVSSADAAKASLEAASARLEEARRLLGETVLRAPFAGTVTAVLLEPGEWTGPGKPILALSGAGEVELEVEVPESILAGLREGREVTLELPFSRSAPVKGRLKSVARAASGPGRLFPVVVSLAPAPGLAPGITAELLLEIESGEILTVPLQAVLNPGASHPGLFCLHEGRARYKTVDLGRIAGERVEVYGDLKAGDLVMITGHTSLMDGEPVEVRS